MRSKFKSLINSQIFLTSIAIIVIFLSFCAYSILVYKNLKEEVIATLGESSHQTAAALRNQIKGEQQAIKDIAVMISSNSAPPEDQMDNLNKVRAIHHFLRMGIISPNGFAITTDNKKLYLGERAYFKAALRGESSVSDRLIDFVDGRIITVYATPIYDGTGKNVTSVLFGTYSIEEYQTSLAMDLFGGKGYSYIVKENGDAISASSGRSRESDFSNFLANLEKINPKNRDARDDLQKGLSSNTHGYIEFASNLKSEKRYLYYIPLEINDWRLLTIVPADVLNHKMFYILSMTFTLGIAIILMCYIILVNMVKTQKKATSVLEEIVFVNKITGNRSYEKFKIDALNILNKKRSEDKYALISIDVDKFKYINDMFGYNEGDKLIRFIDQVCSSYCKADELSAHINADNFALLLKYDGRENLCARLDQIYVSVREYKRPYRKNFEIILSMGIYEIDDSTKEIDIMKDRAEIPRKMKKNNKNVVYAFFDEDVRKKILQDRELENNMHSALNQKEFILMYQPKFWVSDGSLAGAEALVRWKRKDVIIEPNAFVPLFEENGFIVSLDRYVFTQMCSDIKRWTEEGYDVKPISSNLSRKNIGKENIADEYDAIANYYGISKNLVALELTETAFIENESVIFDFVRKLKDRGFEIIMDDFGAGFSSLGLLIDLDIDALKIDRSLIRNIDQNDKSLAIIDVGIQLLHQWKIKVNAEGVETEGQYKQLKQLHCDEVQGYYFAKPMFVEDFEKLMEKRACAQPKAIGQSNVEGRLNPI